MSEAIWQFFTRYVPIPPIFHSLLQDGPFTHCLDCNKELIEADEPYLIERIFHGTEPIMEYAMCFPCRTKLCSELSHESLQRIEAYFEERVVLEDRVELMLKESGSDVNQWIDECLITKRDRADCREYQIMAVCKGDKLVLGPTPFMISGDATEEVGKLLSKQTRDKLGEFTETRFGMPPEFCDSPKPVLF